MRIALCLMFALVFLLNAPADAGQIYKWTDKNGQVHITQTPPPGVAAENVRGGSDRRDDPALQKYCVAVQNAARKVAYAAHSGRPMDDLLAQAEAIENDLLALGASRADIRQIVFFVYGMQSGLQRRQLSEDRVSELARDNCLSGNFAMVRGKSKKPDAWADGSAVAGRSGTGWFVSTDKVVTSLHVVDGMQRIRLHFSDGSETSARITLTDRAHDIAVLATSPREVRPLPLRSEALPLGAAVFTIGFPHAEVMGVRPKLANGVISATSGILDDEAMYQISVPVQAGNSGGPLLDMDGRVVGVVAAKLDAGRMRESTGDLTENVNYAIKSLYVTGLLRNVADDAASNSRSLEALANEVQPSIVRIVAEK